jgi:hypothetical protein
VLAYKTIAVPDRAAPWMAPEAAQSTLLYVSDSGKWIVEVYSFPALKHLGTLTGFDAPQGECSDSRGNLWLANTKSNEMLEFAHGGKSPIKRLVDPTGPPVGCAVDPTTGNLAVTNIFDFSGAGEVLIYRKAGGTPSPYSNPKQQTYYFAGYDGKGNLYVSGQTATGAYILSVLPRGKATMSSVGVRGGALYFPGTVTWSGSSLVLGDQECTRHQQSCLYETTVSGGIATIKGVTHLTGACDVAQAQVQKNLLVGGDYQHCAHHATSSVDLWPFPKGGAATKKVTGVQVPVGTAISVP